MKLFYGLFILSLVSLNIALSQDIGKLKNLELYGVDGHSAKGTVDIYKINSAYKVVFNKNVVIDVVPDGIIVLEDANLRKEIIEPLKSSFGYQEYLLPAKYNLANYEYFSIWCKKYNVMIGRVKL